MTRRQVRKKLILDVETDLSAEELSEAFDSIISKSQTEMRAIVDKLPTTFIPKNGEKVWHGHLSTGSFDEAEQ